MAVSLKDIPFFQDFSASEIDSIKNLFVEKSFRKNDFLFHEGNPCERIFIVREGRIKLARLSSSGREQILEMLGPGDTCACNPGQTVWHCASSAQAVTECKLWFLSRDHYVRLVRTNAKVSRAINKLFAERLQCFSSLIEEVSLKDSKKRLVKFLLDMIAEMKSPDKPTATLFIPFTREEIAQRIGIARETVARQLSQLKRSKLIDLKPHQIIILSKESLQKLLR
jgi:CRP/FNR family transcriptional regulator